MTFLGHACPIPYRLLFGSVRDDADRMRWSIFKLEWSARSTKRKLILIAHVACWPAILVWQGLRAVLKHGHQMPADMRRTRLRQFLELCGLGIGHGFSPFAYYYFRFYEPGRRSAIRLFIFGHEMLTLARHLNPPDRASQMLTNDKLTFFGFCQEAGLPTVPVLALFLNGHALHPDKTPLEELVLPEADLFVKPVGALGGSGATAWYYDGARGYHDQAGRHYEPHHLLECLKQQSRHQPLILQQRLYNTPAIADLAGRCLTTLRVVTVQGPNQPVSVAGACLRIPRAGGVVDNFSHGAAWYGIDVETGRLGSGSTIELGGQRLEVHPETGRRVAGQVIPEWSQTQALCFRAHRAMGGFTLIGWDVALTEQGPVFIEANRRPGFTQTQVATDEPLGRTALVAACLARLHEQPDAGQHASRAEPDQAGV